MKSCPQCNHKLTAVPEVCPECGFVLIKLGFETLGNEDTTREPQRDLPDPSAATLADGIMSSSDSTIKPDNQNDDKASTSSPTIKHLQEPSVSSNDDDFDFEMADDELDFELSDDATSESDEPVIGPGDKTLGSEDITREIRSGQSAVTLADGIVSSSDSTIKPDNQNDDKTSASSPTIKHLQEPSASSNDDDFDFEMADDELDFELSDDATSESDEPVIGPGDKTLGSEDITREIRSDQAATITGDDDDLSFELANDTDISPSNPRPGDETLLVDPMQTMSRPLDDASYGVTLSQSTNPKLPSTVKPPTARPSNTLPGQRLPTIVNPQAALEAAEEFSKGLQSLIPPRTIVRKEEISDSSDYQILKRIGSGAYGTVFSAKQVPLERSVAIKLLQNSTADEQHQQRIKNEFLREAQFTGRLEHPNIVPIHDIGLTVSPKGMVNPFYVMKEIRGQSWHSEIRQKSLRENLEIFKNIVNAIGFAHSQNILHCDLKPDNVMLGEFGEVLVVDWGQAVDLSIPATMRPGGTPAYISPEMAQYWIDLYLNHEEESPSREEVGIRSDVYLLGALLFEAITGTAPHCKSTKEPPYEVIHKAARNYVVDYPDTVNKSLMNIALRTLRVTDGDHIETTGDLLTAIAEYETRSISIELRQRAQQLLVQAKAEADYDYFQRARFGFEEALEKWDGNNEARRGLRDAKLSCAELALEDQNFDLGLGVLEEADGDAETELRKQLTVGKTARDRRKKLVAGLAFGLAGSILLGILINGYMIRENIKSVAARKVADAARGVADAARAVAIKDRDKARVEEGLAKTRTETLETSYERLEAEIEPLKAEIEPLRAEIEPLRAEIKQSAVELQQSESDKQSLQVDITNLNNQTKQLNVQKVKLTKEKDTLTKDRQKLAGQVVELNESSKLLRYKSGLTQISADLQSGDYRDAKKGLAQYENQQDWEVARLNLLAHREIKSLYPSEPINSVSATADGQQLALVFPDRIEVRTIDQLDQPLYRLDRTNVSAVAISPDGKQLYAGKLGATEGSAGQIELFNLTQPNQSDAIRTFSAQSISIDLIDVSEAGNAVLSVGKTSVLRQSSGQGLEEPLMVWVDNQRVDVNLVLPDGEKLKFDSASFSNDGQRILLTNQGGTARDQSAHVFERNESGYQWIASTPIQGISAATFVNGASNEVIAGIQNADTGSYSLARWRFVASPPGTASRAQTSGSMSVISPLDSKIIYLRQQGDFMVATESDRRTTVWDWRNKKSLTIKGQSRPADFAFVKPAQSLETCKVVTTAIGDRPEILSIDLADYQQEYQRQSIDWTPEDPPASVTAMFSSSANGGSLQAFGNDYGIASVFRGSDDKDIDNKNLVQWNISAWHYHVVSDDFVFAQSAEDYLYQYSRTSGALERVLTKLARNYLKPRERIVDLQVSDDGRVALVKTNANLPKFVLWDLQQDRLIREVDYGKQNLFGTGSKKLLPKLSLSRDGKWVVGAKVGVFGWPVDSGQLVRFTSNNASAARAIANSIVFVRNSQQVLVSWQNRIIQFDLSRQQQAVSYSLPQISDVQVRDNMFDAIHDSGETYVLAKDPESGILLLSLEDQKQIFAFEQASFASFAATKNGLRAIAGGLDQESKTRIEIWNPTSSTPKQIPLPSFDDPALNRHFLGFSKVYLSPKHGILLQTTERVRGSVGRQWNSTSVDANLLLGAKVPTAFGRLRVLAQPTIKNVVSNEQQAATLASGQVLFWKLSEKSVKPDGVLDAWATTMRLAPDANTLAIGSTFDHCLLYDFAGRKLLGQIDLKDNQGQITAIAWRADSKTIAVGRSTGVIEVLELNKDNLANSNRKLLQLKSPISSAVSQLAYSQNGDLLATVADQGMAVLIRFEQPGQKDQAAALSETVFRYPDEQVIVAADISADGNRIVSGSNTGQITIWNSQAHEKNSTNEVHFAAGERELLSLPKLHQSPISVVRFVEERNSKTIYSAEQNSGKNEFISWPSAKPTPESADTLRLD